eukprot:gene5711-11529_t
MIRAIVVFAIVAVASAFMPIAMRNSRMEMSMKSNDFQKVIASSLIGASLFLGGSARAEVDYAGIPYLGGSEKIDVNNANVRVYLKLSGMYPTIAGKIVSNGPFKTVADLYNIKGLSSAEKDVIKKYEGRFLALDEKPEYVIDKFNNGYLSIIPEEVFEFLIIKFLAHSDSVLQITSAAASTIAIEIVHMESSKLSTSAYNFSKRRRSLHNLDRDSMPLYLQLADWLRYRLQTAMSLQRSYQKGNSIDVMHLRVQTMRKSKYSLFEKNIRLQKSVQKDAKEEERNFGRIQMEDLFNKVENEKDKATMKTNG